MTECQIFRNLRDRRHRRRLIPQAQAELESWVAQWTWDQHFSGS